jgi:hypothetical protein
MSATRDCRHRDRPRIFVGSRGYKVRIGNLESQPFSVTDVVMSEGETVMDRTDERRESDLIDLGAVSVETQGGAAANIEGFQLQPQVGISDD